MGSRRSATLVVLCVAATAVLAAPAPAAITPASSADQAVAAIAGPGFAANTATYAPLSSPNAVAIRNGGSLVLSTGDATLADHADLHGLAFPNVDNGGGRVTAPVDRGDTALDVTTLQIPFNGLSTASCLSFDLRFLSEEFPRFLDSRFNDAFIAELDDTTWTTSGSAISGLENDFAYDPDGKPLTIKSTGATSMSSAAAAGTPYGGATAPLRAQVVVPAGAASVHTLYLSIFDQADRLYDTAAIVDNLTLTPGTTCTSGATALGPSVAIGGPSTGATVDTATPTLTGTAGDAPGDATTVTVRIYAGTSAAGTPVQTLTAPRSGATWSITTDALPPGQYTAQASQANAQGIEGVSAPVTFSVVRAAAVERQAPVLQTPTAPPAPGKSMVVRPVSGKVAIKLPGAKGFVPLTAITNIPLGAEVDARKGRVAVTSAATTAGVKTQTADFYDGRFQVKQAVPKKKPKKPAALITDIVLTGQRSRSQCAPLRRVRAAAAAPKKKGPKSVLGKLWGNGKGKFRTSGKYSSATVRGTIWLTQDECDGTLTTVRRGVVSVRDFKRKKTVSVKAGHSYLARAR